MCGVKGALTVTNKPHNHLSSRTLSSRTVSPSSTFLSLKLHFKLHFSVSKAPLFCLDNHFSVSPSSTVSLRIDWWSR